MTPVLGILAALFTLACAAFLVRVHLLPTGYRPASNAVSDYGVGPYSRYYRWQTAASAYAALLVAAAIARTTQPVPQLIVFLLLTFAIARLLIPTFERGPVHLLLAGAAFGAIAWCAAALPDHVDWTSLHGTLVVLGWIVAGSAAACALARSVPRVTEPFFGALERVFYAATLVWLLVISLHFL